MFVLGISDVKKMLQMQQHLNMLHGAANNGTHHVHQNFPAGGLAGSYQNFLSMAAALQRPTAVASPPPPPMPPNTVGPPPHPPQMWSPHPPHQTMPQHASNHMMHFANHHQQWLVTYLVLCISRFFSAPPTTTTCFFLNFCENIKMKRL